MSLYLNNVGNILEKIPPVVLDSDGSALADSLQRSWTVEAIFQCKFFDIRAVNQAHCDLKIE